MSKLQTEITEWANATFPNSTPAAKILHLWEELQEAYFELPVTLDKAEEEIADCVLITAHLASSLDVELPELTSIALETAVELKLAKCKMRKWGKPDDQGVVRHIKETNE